MTACDDSRLRALLDRQEILDVLHRYCRGLDRFDRELLRGCYWDDATEDHGRFIGSPEDFIEWGLASTAPFARAQHCILNHYCTFDGADDAHAETYYMFIGVAARPPHLYSTGRYVDRFQRRNGEWRIADRVMVLEATFDLQDSNLWGHLPPPEHGLPDAPVTRDRGDVSYQRPLRPRQVAEATHEVV